VTTADDDGIVLGACTYFGTHAHDPDWQCLAVEWQGFGYGKYSNEDHWAAWAVSEALL
jgi:hypothetical protein